MRAISSSSTTPRGKTRQLTKTTDAETNPRFTQDGKRVSFTRGGNLYVMSLDGGMLVQLTDIRAGRGRRPRRLRRRAVAADAVAAAAVGRRRRRRAGRGRYAPAEQRGTDSQEYLKKEQKRVARRGARARGTARGAAEEAAHSDPRKPFTLQARQTAGPACNYRPTRSTSSPASSKRPPTPAKSTIVPELRQRFRLHGGHSRAAPTWATARAPAASPSSTRRPAT